MGKINLRVYFAFFKEKNEVVILKVYKKEGEHQTPRHILINPEDRYEDYLDGKLRAGATILHGLENGQA